MMAFLKRKYSSCCSSLGFQGPNTITNIANVQRMKSVSKFHVWFCDSFFLSICFTQPTCVLLYRGCGWGGYCQRAYGARKATESPLFWLLAGGWSAEWPLATTLRRLFCIVVCWVACGGCCGCGGGVVVWCRTTSVGCTLLLCSSRFRSLLRTRRMAIIVPLLPTILLEGPRDVKPKIAIFRPFRY